MSPSITLVVPNKDDSEGVLQIFESLVHWVKLPDEIIVVDCSKIPFSIPDNINAFLIKSNINFKIIRNRNLFPGHARNLGVSSSSSDLIAFLDANTHPNSVWLSSNFDDFCNSENEIVWGTTKYLAKSNYVKVIQASTFGSIPIKTLPGSLISKSIFSIVGKFINFIRAGEDADWIKRAELHNIQSSTSSEPLIYESLNKLTYISLLKKWFRNFSHASNLPYISNHRTLYLYIAAMAFTVSAFNWNWIIADWRAESFLYIPNITKITIIFVLFLYFLIRGILIPLKKGTTLKYLLPFNFIKVAILSFLIDLTKLLAFILSNKPKNYLD